jgi:hypothetical protein
MIKSCDINLAIKGKYSGPEWRVWFEVSEATGSYSGRRADAVVMNIWPSKAYQLHVFEVKVSRSDFKQEMADLTKWNAVGKYSDFFWLACPAGLVSPNEVPESWGLMEMTKGGLRIKKQAPARAEKTALDRGFVASLLRSGEDLTEAQIKKRVDERVADGIASAVERIDNRHKAQLNELKLRADSCDDWKTRFEADFGARPNTYRPPEEMAARIRMAMTIDTGGLAKIAAQARHLANQIDEVQP